MTTITPKPLPDALPLPESWRAHAGRLPAPQVAAILLAILRTLGAWHAHGRCHGSLSLEDVQRGGDGEIWVLPPAGQADAPRQEQQGYAAFECYGDAASDSRTDVYAVCAIGWSLLTGHRPPSALARAVQNPDSLDELDAERLREPGNQALGEVLLRGLAFFPEDRHASVAVLEEAVRASVAASEPDASRDEAAPVIEVLEDERAAEASTIPEPVPDAAAQVAPASVVVHKASDDDKRAPLPLIAAVVLLLLGAGVYWWLDRAAPTESQQESAAQAVIPDVSREAPASDMPAASMADAAGQASPGLPEAPEPQHDLQALADAQTQDSAPQAPEQESMAAVPDDTAQVMENDDAAEPPPPPKPAAVTVTLSITPWAEVYVNGVRRGVSPPMRTLSLEPGSHRIELRNGHDAPKQIQLRVQEGKPATLSHRFE